MDNINALVEKAKQLNSENKIWHFHMLVKNCQFNKAKGHFAIIFEDENSDRYTLLFDEKPLTEAKQLADLMYGENFLDKQKVDHHNPIADEILKKATKYSEQEINWHHHHLHPECVFNQHKGKHCIVFEDPETNEFLTAVYDNKPMEDLVKIEKLFYQYLKKE